MESALYFIEPMRPPGTNTFSYRNNSITWLCRILLLLSILTYGAALLLPAIHVFGQQGLINIETKDFAGWECLIWGILSPVWWCSNPMLWQSWSTAFKPRGPKVFRLQLPMPTYAVVSLIVSIYGLSEYHASWKSGSFAYHDSPILFGAYIWIVAIGLEFLRVLLAQVNMRPTQ